MTRIDRLFAGHFRRRGNYRALRNVRLNPATITKAGWSDNCVNLPCNVGATYHEGRRVLFYRDTRPKTIHLFFHYFAVSVVDITSRASSFRCTRWAAAAITSLFVMQRESSLRAFTFLYEIRRRHLCCAKLKVPLNFYLSFFTFFELKTKDICVYSTRALKCDYGVWVWETLA